MYLDTLSKEKLLDIIHIYNSHSENLINFINSTDDNLVDILHQKQ